MLGGLGGTWRQAGVQGRLREKGLWAGEQLDWETLGAHLDEGALGDSESSWFGGTGATTAGWVTLR